MKKEKIITLTDALIKDLKDIGIPISNNIEEIVINHRAKARFGACKIKNRALGRRSFVIELSEEVLNCGTKEISAIIIHELLHTCDGCFNHGKKWKKYCEKVEETLAIKISRTQRYEDLGLERPSEKEKIKYIVKCQGCGAEFPRKRICSLVKNPENYRCGKCGNILYLQGEKHNIL